MFYFIKNQFESADRNNLDKEMREWAAENLHHWQVDVSYMPAFIQHIKNKADELNVKYKRCKRFSAVASYTMLCGGLI